MALEKASGIIIRLSDYSETSQIVTFLTDTHGKVSAIAKGAKRAKSATGGAMDLLTLNEIVFSPSASGGLGTLREARTTAQYPGLRKSTQKYYAGLYFAELAGIFGEGSEGSQAHYEVLKETLEALDEGKISDWNLTAYFESHILAASGLEPNLTNCARCGSEAGEGTTRMSLEEGGILCGRCQGGREIDKGSLATLRKVFSTGLLTAGRLKIPEQTRRVIGGLLTALVLHGAGRAPRLTKYVKGEYGRQWRRWAGETPVSEGS